MATPEDITTLRYMLGEAIPPGGTEEDTLFPDTQLAYWVDSTPNLNRAAHQGWMAKAAQFANLVNVTDGAASREFSDLLTNARAMVAQYAKSGDNSATDGRSRVGRIVRR